MGGVRHASCFLLVPLLAVALAGCGTPAAPPEERTFSGPDGAFTLDVPPGWRVLRGEVRSPSGTLLSTKMMSLEGGDETWIEALPGSLLPQLEEWARYFFTVEGAPAVTAATLGGERAMEASFAIKIRPADPPSKAVFWVARHGDNVHIVRVTYVPGKVAEDEPGVQAMVASWRWADGGSSIAITVPTAEKP